MEVSVGDLLEHVGFSRNSRVKRFAEVAEVTAGKEAILFIDNDPKPRTIQHFELLRWWETIVVHSEVAPPSWVKKHAVFRARTPGLANRAIIHSVHPGWISFFDHTQGQPQVFRIVEYEKFRAHWEPDVNPSIWERLLNEDVV